MQHKVVSRDEWIAARKAHLANEKAFTKARATLMRPLFDIPGIGRIAILRQPGGAGVGWMTPATA